MINQVSSFLREAWRVTFFFANFVDYNEFEMSEMENFSVFLMLPESLYL